MTQRILELYARRSISGQSAYCGQYSMLQGDDYDKMVIAKTVSGVWTELSSYTGADVPQSPATASFKANGTTLTFTVGALTKSTTNSSLTTGADGPAFQGHLVDYGSSDSWKLGQARVQTV